MKTYTDNNNDNNTTKYNVVDSKTGQKRVIAVSSDCIIIDDTVYLIDYHVGSEYKIKFNISDSDYEKIITKIVIGFGTVVLKNICDTIIAEYMIMPDSGYLGPRWIMYQIMQKDRDYKWYGTEYNITFSNPLFLMTEKDRFMFCSVYDKKNCDVITNISKSTDYVRICYSYTTSCDETSKTSVLEVQFDEKRMPIILVWDNKMFPITRFR